MTVQSTVFLMKQVYMGWICEKQETITNAESVYLDDKVILKGRDIAQAVSRWLPTAVGQLQVRVSSCEICSDQSGSGAGFLRVLRFPLPISILRLNHNHHHHLSSGAGTIGQTVGAVPNGLSLTP
jgi:hypothetical protein